MTQGARDRTGIASDSVCPHFPLSLKNLGDDGAFLVVRHLELLGSWAPIPWQENYPSLGLCFLASSSVVLSMIISSHD